MNQLDINAVPFIQDLWNSLYHTELDPNRICCSIQGKSYSYEEFSFQVRLHSNRLIEFRKSNFPNVLNSSNNLENNEPFVTNNIQRTPARNPRIGVIIEDQFDTYCYIVACLIQGCAFVPIQPSYPKSRLEDILEMAELDAWFGPHNTPVIGNTSLFHLNSADLTSSLSSSNGVLISNDVLSSEASTQSLLNSNVHSEYPWENLLIDFPINFDNTAYILFTSGTTGKPKGVPISYSNLQHFYEGFWSLGYSLSASDRFLQMFELTFDLSVSSFLIPLCLGASFHTLDKSIIKPLALYDVLESQQISFALMVPSAVEMLAPYSDDIELPELKYTQFCGEALKLNQLNTWSACCPNSQIDNVYGPTEATIYCTRYTAYPLSHPPKQKNGIVCIGQPMKHVSLKLSESNELMLGGLQTTSGYLHSTDEQKAKFQQGYYLSGDLAEFDGVDYYCLGRLDDQVKVQGYRIELSELEFAASRIRENVRFKAVAIVSESNTRLHLFCVSEKLNSLELPSFESQLKDQLPWYMVPHQIHEIPDFPLNVNGKIDKKQLIEMYVKP